MSLLFTVMIMWVLVYNGLCSVGLALGYTIATGVGVVITSISKVNKEYKENQREKDLQLAKMFAELEEKHKNEKA